MNPFEVVDQRSLSKSQTFAKFVTEQADVHKLTLFELSLAIQSIENASREQWGESFDVSWNLARRVWQKAKELRLGKT